MNKKTYILDSNILLEDADSIEILRNGEENKIVIPNTVLEELDKLKNDNKVKPQVTKAVNKLLEKAEEIEVPNTLEVMELNKGRNPDNQILEEIKTVKKDHDNVVFVTNDKLFAFKANKKGIHTEEFKNSKPFNTEDEIYSGFIEIGEERVPNCFYWREDNRLCQYRDNAEKVIDHSNVTWGIHPKNDYQNAAFELALNDKINVVTLMSDAGLGKTVASLASALKKVLEEKKYNKIIIVRRRNDVGEDIGYLPGSAGEKMGPYFRPVEDLIYKLHEKRPANKLFRDPQDLDQGFNSRYIEFMPPNFMRGLNIENSYVVIDEATNLSRYEIRTVLSRMGENVKVVCTGDVKQIDNIRLDSQNNGLNWVIKHLTGYKNYGHVTIKGNHSRGPICDLVRKSGL